MRDQESQPAPDADVLADLVAECLQRLGQGAEEVPFEEICREHPHLVDEVRQAVEFSGGLPELQAAGMGGDPLLASILAGRYRIDSRLGSGAMGVVYAGTDLELGRSVAIKVVHTRLIDEEQAVLRFDREAAALASISHNAVVTIHDRGVTDTGQPFLVMERIDGVSCSEILTLAVRHKGDDDTAWLTEEFGIESLEEPSLLRQMVRWVASVASGLDAAHAAGVFHRDVKPSNIMIRKDGRPVLLDFGIATREDDKTLTRADSAIGTPAYMAPEALLGAKVKSGASRDVYGLAATLYHLLTLEAPYRGTPSEILAALATREPEPAFKLRPGLPRDAQAILDHGLDRTPTNRYPTPAAMELDLRALLAFQPVSVSPTSNLTRTIRRLRRSKAAVAIGAALLATVGLVSASKINTTMTAGRMAAYDVAHARIPANLGVVGPANRFIADEGLRRGVAQTLDELVAAKHDVVPAHAIRASFRLDHGDVAGAKEDMASVARAVGSDYATELSARYAALAPDAGGALALDLENMPTPETKWDAYLAGYHAMRTNRYADGIEPLGHAGLADVRHAQELSTLLQSVGIAMSSADSPEMFELTRLMSDAALRIEAKFGYVSAGSAHLRGFAAAREHRWEDALAYCAEGLQLAPSSYVINRNACICSTRLNRFEDAVEFGTEALRVVPNYLHCQKIVWEAEAHLGHYEAARLRVSEASTNDVPSGRAQRKRFRGQIDLEEAIDLMEVDQGRSKLKAQEALAIFEALPDDQFRKAELVSVARACLTSDKRSIFSAYLNKAASEPLSFLPLRRLKDHWPEDLTEQESALAAAWLSSVIESIAPAASRGVTLSTETK